jgi:hypothetical protein
MSDHGVVQVVMHDFMLEPFRAWLQSKRLDVFEMPLDDGIPTYGISPLDIDAAREGR